MPTATAGVAPLSTETFEGVVFTSWSVANSAIVHGNRNCAALRRSKNLVNVDVSVDANLNPSSELHCVGYTGSWQQLREAWDVQDHATEITRLGERAASGDIVAARDLMYHTISDRYPQLRTVLDTALALLDAAVANGTLSRDAILMEAAFSTMGTDSFHGAYSDEPGARDMGYSVIRELCTSADGTDHYMVRSVRAHDFARLWCAEREPVQRRRLAREIAEHLIGLQSRSKLFADRSVDDVADDIEAKFREYAQRFLDGEPTTIAYETSAMGCIIGVLVSRYWGEPVGRDVHVATVPAKFATLVTEANRERRRLTCVVDPNLVGPTMEHTAGTLSELVTLAYRKGFNWTRSVS